MGPTRATPGPDGRTLAETLSRHLRHEAGDLLQSLYAAVSVLHRRLPAGCDFERQLLADLRRRAESCRHQLDAAQDLACPLELAPEPFDLAEVSAAVAASAAARHPHLEVRAEAAGPVPVVADRARLTLVGQVLLAALCRSAQARVRVAAAVVDGLARWSATDDGPGVPEEESGDLFDACGGPRPSAGRVGLALAHKVAALHGGRVVAGNVPGGGFEVTLFLPLAADSAPS